MGWQTGSAWFLALGVVACATSTVEPYDYEHDGDEMFGSSGITGGSGGGGSTGGTGSSSEIDGDWEGNCQVDLYGYAYDFGLELGVKTNDDGSLGGRGALLLYGYAYTGDLRGEEDGSAVDLRFDAMSSGYPITVTLEGERSGDEYSGACTVVGYTGKFRVERV